MRRTAVLCEVCAAEIHIFPEPRVGIYDTLYCDGCGDDICCDGGLDRDSPAFAEVPARMIKKAG